MRKFGVVLLALSMFACGDDEGTDDPPGCKNGAEQCAGDVAQVCAAEKWTTAQDCGADGMVCQATPGGGGAVGCVGLCDTNGFDTNTISFMMDDLLYATQSGPVQLGTADDTNDPANIWAVEHYVGWPGSGTPGSTTTVDLAGDNANYYTCGTCMFLQDPNGMYVYQSFTGSADGTVPTATGDTMAVAHIGAEYQGVEIDGSYQTTPVAGGMTWCLNQTFSATTTWFECGQNVSIGDTVCMTDGSTIYVLYTCDANNYLVRGTDCAANSQQCDQADDPNATCFTP